MAVYRKDVYCEFEFLKKFRSSNGRISPLHATDALWVWIGMSKFIQKSHLMLDVNAQTFKKSIRNNDAISYLWKRATEGVCKMSFVNEHKKEFFENLIITREGLDKIYLLAKHNSICKNWAKKVGTIVLSPTCWQSNEEAKKYAYLFKDCGISINEGDKIDWGDILKEEYNLSDCNSMIIIDNYILQDVNNLKRVIEQFLPKPMEGFKREHEFYVTVITGKAKNNPNRNDKHIYEQLVEDIKQSHPDLNCHIDLFVEQFIMSHTFHDRHILTNNVFITIGGGFDSFDKHGKAEKQTSTSLLHPGIQSVRPACDDEYMNIINRVCCKVVNCTTRGQWRHYPEESSCKNRLILKHPDIKEL